MQAGNLKARLGLGVQELAFISADASQRWTLLTKQAMEVLLNADCRVQAVNMLLEKRLAVMSAQFGRSVQYTCEIPDAPWKSPCLKSPSPVCY